MEGSGCRRKAVQPWQLPQMDEATVTVCAASFQLDRNRQPDKICDHLTKQRGPVGPANEEQQKNDEKPEQFSCFKYTQSVF